MQNYYELVDSNKRKSLVIMTGFILFVFVAVYSTVILFDLPVSYLAIGFIFSLITSIGSYYYSDKIVLSISGARPATKSEFFNYYTVAENIALAAQIPMPKLYVIQDSAMNAFATGRDPKHAVVCATTGLLSRLDRTELEGVVAHEMAHIRNYDIRLMSIVTILVGFIALIADLIFRSGISRDRKESNQLGSLLSIIGLLLILLSPIIATLIKLAISRRREFLADASAASITKYPEGLARALEKLSQDTEPLEAANKATAHLYITNPLKNHHDSIGWFAAAFSTHPPIKDRIAALRSQV